MDRYVKKKKIGEGSFGKALLVQSKTDGKEYVIKEISISKMKRKEREESKKEVAVLKQMKHPNIVSYQESFEEVGNLYIVMDYCDGGDLYKAINSQRGILFTEDKVLDWFVQICLALKHVHDRKILHRDLKSQNIFLTRKGIIKLGDFGIARVLNSTMELARTCIGTPYYLSPEICENRPYNNKSDVWALGCVLYELCTLKHAFEAGNMKNLVLKIIRGSYPPVSPRYSYELRNLIALLFKRNPRDRPSINTILKKPLIQKRIQSFLTETQVSVEFSHTILHRKRPGAPSVGGGRPVMAPPVRKPVQPVRISNPSAKYGVSVAAKKPPSAGAKRVPGNKIMNNKDFEKKKQELIAKERERRNQNIQVRVRQQKLADKQRMDRMNRAREVGWKSTLSSGEGSSEQEKLPSGEPPRKEPKMDDNGGERPFIEPKPAKQERGKYDHYHDYLDNLKQGAKVEPAFGGIAYKRQAEDNAWPNNQQISEQIRNRPVSASAAEAARRAAENRAFAANAANRGKEAQEFWERKRQAAMNKARGNAQMMGWAEPAAVPKQKENQPANQLNAFRNKDEQDYLERLKAIRVQNYNERRQVQKQAFGGDAVKASIADPRVDADARRKKIEALKAQADERAAKLKEELARKRQEAFQKEKQHRDEHVRKMAEGGPAVRAVPAQAQPVKGPVAQVLGITDALKQIHSDKGVEVQEQERPSAIEKKKDNQKVPEKRKQWGAGDRKALPLNNMPLEITASGMEATGVADAVVKHDQHTEHSSVAAGRKHWAGHGETVLNALQARQLALETTTFASLQPGSQMGVTVIKGTAKTPVPKSPIQPGTITISKEVKKTTDNTSEGIEPAAVPKQKENQPANQLNAFRNKDEQDYLERLKAIRVQNYNERRQVQKQAFGGEAVKASIGDPRVDADARRKKIEALKAQADERAAKLKEELARKRQEAFQKEKQHRDGHVRKMAEGGPAVRAVPAQAQPVKVPVAQVLGITDALKQIHSDKGVEVQEQERPSAIEKEKENQKVPEKRKQWGAGDRKALPLNNMPLEITASGMEATGVADAVVKHDQHTEHSSVAAGRKHWAGHGETVLNALQARQLALETTTFASLQPGSQMGVTVIKGAAKTPVPKSPIQPGTITISKEVKKTTDNTSEESIETIIVTESKGEKEPGKSKAAWSDGIKEDKSDQQTEADDAPGSFEYCNIRR
ncbi:serine/threonine-protein kinase Nek1-like [Anneissia japonica]|uniref:serine/threonine-protein kinase Nek1-like n=1 Tax=Anneissia japonica TaxID=1529436 RepID=UPI0014256040|nr:serine/threonine-protein kinase Nek1-like [Anneissia japonica]